jgi:hypothetical protein
MKLRHHKAVYSANQGLLQVRFCLMHHVQTPEHMLTKHIDINESHICRNGEICTLQMKKAQQVMFQWVHMERALSTGVEALSE